MTNDPAQLLDAIPAISALVVEPILSDAIAITSALAACQFQVTIADTFAKAKDRLNTQIPEILVTAIRLAEYNGLQLVLRAKASRPEIAAIVMSSAPDPVLQADAEAMGATFVLKPVVDKELAAAVFRTVFQPTSGTPSKPLRPLFERRLNQRRASVVPIPRDRRSGDRRRALESLLRVVARRN